MRLLLPPSETKRDGGAGDSLELDRLSFPVLTPQRVESTAAVVGLSGEPAAMMRALKLGPRQAHEVDRNRSLRESATMPALDRYTGVLFDALDAPTLDEDARAFAAEHVVVHSALFGLVGAMDEIPAYRLSHDSRVPGLRLRQHWRAAIVALLESGADAGVVLDLRSEGYAELGPAPARGESAFVRVVAVDASGRSRALNHFNKRAKGLFTRALLTSRPQIASIDELIEWAHDAGFTLSFAPQHDAGLRELELVA
ncbi:peroxide stress protein YaaA [Agromyces badenianii]|uniref:Peroxide stress protein YaaA n=1 Tax=Agromyces badenianii TaxID=2080742 RepID=A0A2S0WUU3_9MICO|nr:peroxide stress protein YaaA [Agromyces badenianii]AWB95070.1 peroxide stress protein YaaA [Agromyces badenianii]